MVIFLELNDKVFISKEIPLTKGQFVQVEVTGSAEFDLYGKVVAEFMPVR